MLKNVLNLFRSGDQLGLSFLILQLIHQGFSKLSNGKPLELFLRKELQKLVYDLLPKKWKAPFGKLSELEFYDIIDDGIVFYQAIQQAFR